MKDKTVAHNFRHPREGGGLGLDSRLRGNDGSRKRMISFGVAMLLSVNFVFAENNPLVLEWIQRVCPSALTKGYDLDGFELDKSVKPIEDPGSKEQQWPVMVKSKAPDVQIIVAGGGESKKQEMRSDKVCSGGDGTAILLTEEDFGAIGTMGKTWAEFRAEVKKKLEAPPAAPVESAAVSPTALAANAKAVPPAVSPEAQAVCDSIAAKLKANRAKLNLTSSPMFTGKKICKADTAGLQDIVALMGDLDKSEGDCDAIRARSKEIQNLPADAAMPQDLLDLAGSCRAKPDRMQALRMKILSVQGQVAAPNAKPDQIFGAQAQGRIASLSAAVGTLAAGSKSSLKNKTAVAPMVAGIFDKAVPMGPGDLSVQAGTVSGSVKTRKGKKGKQELLPTQPPKRAESPAEDPKIRSLTLPKNLGFQSNLGSSVPVRAAGSPYETMYFNYAVDANVSGMRGAQSNRVIVLTGKDCRAKNAGNSDKCSFDIVGSVYMDQVMKAKGQSVIIPDPTGEGKYEIRMATVKESAVKERIEAAKQAEALRLARIKDLEDKLAKTAQFYPRAQMKPADLKDRLAGLDKFAQDEIKIASAEDAVTLKKLQQAIVDYRKAKGPQAVSRKKTSVLNMQSAILDLRKRYSAELGTLPTVPVDDYLALDADGSGERLEVAIVDKKLASAAGEMDQMYRQADVLAESTENGLSGEGIDQRLVFVRDIKKKRDAKQTGYTGQLPGQDQGEDLLALAETSLNSLKDDSAIPADKHQAYYKAAADHLRHLREYFDDRGNEAKAGSVVVSRSLGSMRGDILEDVKKTGRLTEITDADGNKRVGYITAESSLVSAYDYKHQVNNPTGGRRFIAPFNKKSPMVCFVEDTRGGKDGMLNASGCVEFDPANADKQDLAAKPIHLSAEKDLNFTYAMNSMKDGKFDFSLSSKVADRPAKVEGAIALGKGVGEGLGKAVGDVAGGALGDPAKAIGSGLASAVKGAPVPAAVPAPQAEAEPALEELSDREARQSLSKIETRRAHNLERCARGNVRVITVMEQPIVGGPATEGNMRLCLKERADGLYEETVPTGGYKYVFGLQTDEKGKARIHTIEKQKSAQQEPVAPAPAPVAQAPAVLPTTPVTERAIILDEVQGVLRAAPAPRRRVAHRVVAPGSVAKPIVPPVASPAPAPVDDGSHHGGGLQMVVTSRPMTRQERAEAAKQEKIAKKQAKAAAKAAAPAASTVSEDENDRIGAAIARARGVRCEKSVQYKFGDGAPPLCGTRAGDTLTVSGNGKTFVFTLKPNTNEIVGLGK